MCTQVRFITIAVVQSARFGFGTSTYDDYLWIPSEIGLGQARPGDRVWRGVKICAGPFEDVIYYKDQFCAISHAGQIYAIQGKVGRQVGRYPFEFSYFAEHFYLERDYWHPFKALIKLLF